MRHIRAYLLGDFYEETSKRKLFLMTLIKLMISLTLAALFLFFAFGVETGIVCYAEER